MSSSLSDLLVLETAQHVAGPYCGKLLADHGANVVKVEPPEFGDSARSVGPFPGGVPDNEQSATFLHLNTNKKSVILDLETHRGRAEAQRLCRQAAVVIDDGTLTATGAGYEELAEENPSLIFVSITGFGDDGPYARFALNDYVAYAASAWMAAMGDPDKPPLYPGVDYPFYVTGIYAAFGVFAALRHARRTGRGQQVSVSVLNASISIDFYETSKYASHGRLRRRDGHMITGVAASVQPCLDGYIAVTFSGEADWGAFTRIIGAPELAEGRFAEAAERLERAEELNELLQSALRDKRVDDVVRQSQEQHIAISRVATTSDVYASEQLRSRGWFGPLDRDGRKTEYPGAPFRLQSPSWRLEKAAPHLGEHTREFLEEVQ